MKLLGLVIVFVYDGLEKNIYILFNFSWIKVKQNVNLFNVNNQKTHIC